MDLTALQLTAGIDTFEVVADVQLDQEPTGVRNMGTRPQTKTHGKQWRYKVTIDKYREQGSGYNLQEVLGVVAEVQQIFRAANCTELFISRCDIRFDNFAPRAYSSYYKLNQCLLSLVAYELKIPNRYGSIDPLTGELKSICIGKNKNNDRQAEYYNKAAQKPELGISARLELRSIQRNIDLLSPFDGFAEGLADEWFNILRQAANKSVFTALKADINKHLIANYNDKMFTGKLEYIAYNGLRIYDRQQARDISAALGASERNGGNFFANRPAQQQITIDDIRAYIDILEQSAIEFFDERQ